MPSDTDTAYPRTAVAWGIVGILFLTTVLSSVDRYILNVLIDPIRTDLKISDVQISLLQGLAVSILGVVSTPILGAAVDRLPRRRLLMGGIAIWSLATLSSGLAQNFPWLFASRMAMGLGGAVLLPAALSLISDAFSPAKRGLPIGVYLMGQTVGVGAAIMLTGLLAGAAPSLNLPFSPWRATFILCSLAGVGVIASYLTFSEPPRIGAAAAAEAGAGRPGLAAAAAFFRSRAAFFAPFYLGLTTVNAAISATTAWEAALLMRRFGMTPQQVGSSLGVALLAVGVCGYLIAGAAMQRLTRRYGRTANLLVLGLTPLLMLPGGLAGLAPNAAACIVQLCFITFLTPAIYVAVNLTLTQVTPNHLRGVSIGLASMANALFGITFGPLLVGLATQHLYGDSARVGLSMATVAVPALLTGAGLFLASYAALRRWSSDPV